MAGVIDAVGAGVVTGRKASVLASGGTEDIVASVRLAAGGDFLGCKNFIVTGFHVDGGYAEYLIAHTEALAAIPDALTSTKAAPILCAGITTFNSLRHSGAKAGDLVAVQGVGGFGHLGVQFANKMGFHTVAIGRGQHKAELALQLGAESYLDAEMTDPAKELQVSAEQP